MPAPQPTMIQYPEGDGMVPDGEGRVVGGWLGTVVELAVDGTVPGESDRVSAIGNDTPEGHGFSGHCRIRLDAVDGNNGTGVDNEAPLGRFALESVAGYDPEGDDVLIHGESVVFDDGILPGEKMAVAVAGPDVLDNGADLQGGVGFDPNLVDVIAIDKGNILDTGLGPVADDNPGGGPSAPSPMLVQYPQ